MKCLRVFKEIFSFCYIESVSFSFVPSVYNVDMRQRGSTILQPSRSKCDHESQYTGRFRVETQDKSGSWRWWWWCCWVPSVVSDSVWPYRRQPTRLPCPWDSPGKNTGVGCHFLLQCMKVKSESEVTQSRLTLRDLMDCRLPGSSVHGIFQARVLEWVAIAFSGRWC